MYPRVFSVGKLSLSLKRLKDVSVKEEKRDEENAEEDAEKEVISLSD